VDEGLGAVDGVDVPAEGGVRAFFIVELFADDGMGGVALFDAPADELLGELVGQGDGGLVALEVGVQAGLVIAEGQAPRQVGGLDGKFVIFGEIHGECNACGERIR
jgi:hypothetical protein